MRKMRLIGIIGACMVIAVIVVLKITGLQAVFGVPFLLPFLVMILIDISARNKTS